MHTDRRIGKNVSVKRCIGQAATAQLYFNNSSLVQQGCFKENCAYVEKKKQKKHDNKQTKTGLVAVPREVCFC